MGATSSIPKEINDLKTLLTVQGKDGNWNYDEYMLGLYNGLEMAVSIWEHREPIFRNFREQKKINTFWHRIKNKLFPTKPIPVCTMPGRRRV